MDCPHCDYSVSQEGEWGGKGEEVKFFELSTRPRRAMPHDHDETRTLFGCPQCLKTFISEY